MLQHVEASSTGSEGPNAAAWVSDLAVGFPNLKGDIRLLRSNADITEIEH